jgi:hypothetical protein
MQTVPSSYSGPGLAPDTPSVDRGAYRYGDGGNLGFHRMAARRRRTIWMYLLASACTAALGESECWRAISNWVFAAHGGKVHAGCENVRARQGDCAMGQPKSSGLATASHRLVVLHESDVGAKARLGFALIVMGGTRWW